jgi:hypothetical protein
MVTTGAMEPEICFASTCLEMSSFSTTLTTRGCHSWDQTCVSLPAVAPSPSLLFPNFINLCFALDTEFLYFSGTGFAGDLAPLPINLVEFDASFTLISGGLVDATFAGLDMLNFLVLDGNAYNSSVPNVLGSLADLEFLYISDAFISGDLSYMEGMPSIIEHWIDVNPGLGGPVFPFIGSLSTLQSFSVTLNDLTGNMPTELGNLPDMKQMWYYGNRLSGQIPVDYGRLVTMTILQLEGNDFTGSMPTEICDNRGFLRPLVTLGVDCDEVTVSFDATSCLRTKWTPPPKLTHIYLFSLFYSVPPPLAALAVALRRATHLRLLETGCI